MGNTKTLWAAFFFMSTIFLVNEVFLEERSAKTACIDINRLYSEFKLSKELDIELKKIQLSRKNILDSLTVQYEKFGALVTEKNVSEEIKKKFEMIATELGLKQQQFTEDNALLTQRYNQQIYTQINQYIEDYRIKNQYDYIFGGTGEGSIMAVDEKFNITNEVLKFINSRYEGK